MAITFNKLFKCFFNHVTTSNLSLLLSGTWVDPVDLLVQLYMPLFRGIWHRHAPFRGILHGHASFCKISHAHAPFSEIWHGHASFRGIQYSTSFFLKYSMLKFVLCYTVCVQVVIHSHSRDWHTLRSYVANKFGEVWTLKSGTFGRLWHFHTIKFVRFVNDSGKTFWTQPWLYIACLPRVLSTRTRGWMPSRRSRLFT